MDITCPHCHKVIDLVGAKQLADDYGLSSNTVQHYKTRGFPEPVLTFGNRRIYLRRDIDNWYKERSRNRVVSTVETLMRDLDHLPEKEKEEARKLLEERLGLNGGNPVKKPTPTNGRRHRQRM